MIMSVLPSFAERKRYPFHARVFRRCTLSGLGVNYCNIPLLLLGVNVATAVYETTDTAAVSVLGSIFEENK